MDRKEAADFLKQYVDNECYTEKCQEAHRMAVAALSQPNEPLTMAELREMEQSTPVWWDCIPCWVLVRRGWVLVFGSEPHKAENLLGNFYRRPPEGENG